ncbi:MAG: PspC domain-containing protein [Bacteroidota bacterium]
MNKIVNINLGGYPFTIDDDAYEYLKQYLSSIRSHFAHSEGCEEIVSDIEDRLAELFQENLGGRPILTIKEVEAAVKTMGMPEEFEEENTEDQAAGSRTKFSRTGKKLFRSSDDKVLGGVCSGISAYFGIEDPVWIRVAVAITFFMGGMGFLPYIILWVILPAAKTSADKLAMKGEPINVSNIAKTVEEEINNLTKKITELGEELSTKYGKEKKKKQSESEDEKDPENNRTDDEGDNFQFAAGQYVDQGFEVIGAVVFNVGQFFRTSGKTLLFIICAALLATVAASWIGLITGFTFIFPYESYFVNSPITAFVGLSSLLMMVGIPILFVVFLLMKVVFRTRLSTYWGLALWGIWFVALGAMTVVGTSMTKEFNEETSLEDNIDLNIDDQSIMKLSITDGDYDDIITNFGHVVLTDGKLMTDLIRFNITKSDNDQFELKKIRTSRGKNQELATRFAHAALHDVKVTENGIEFPSHFAIDRGNKWRGQQITFELKVPEGRSIEFDRAIANKINKMETAEQIWHYKLGNKKLTMTEDGIVCDECGEKEESLSLEEEQIGAAEEALGEAEEAIERAEDVIERAVEEIETTIEKTIKEIDQ